jgi:hypothetical protein
MLLLLRVLAFVPMVLAARMRHTERRTITRLTDAGANIEERAILLEQEGPVSDFVYKRLLNAGALVFAGKDRYYLNQRAYEAFRSRRRQRAMIVLASVVIIVALLYFFGVIS